MEENTQALHIYSDLPYDDEHLSDVVHRLREMVDSYSRANFRKYLRLSCHAACLWFLLLGLFLFQGADLHHGLSIWKNAGCIAGFKINCGEL